jgi:flagellar motility protein MotE (MotC chaperone)
VRIWQPRYFVISLIAVALVVLGVRLESLWQNVLYGTTIQTIAAATAEDEPAKAEKAPANPPAVHEATTKEEKKAEADKKIEAEHKAAADAAADEADRKAEASHAPPPEDLSQGEMEVLKQLSSRRALLDQREQEIVQKNAILQAAEMRVDQKVKDMEKLRTQLQTMLGQVSEQQQAQTDNLVKIYEVMKPKEAARILQTLDMPVLLGVMKQMKPAKSAPILAEMEAVKAKDITMTLAKQHDLPDTKSAN